MLQATAFLCGAYATESIQRRAWDEAAALLDKAQELTRKGVLRKCRETDLVRCGLRAATFHVHALLHRQMGCHGQAVRMLQRALKVTRQKQGLEVTEAATLINLGSVSPRLALPVCACIYARTCVHGWRCACYVFACVCVRRCLPLCPCTGASGARAADGRYDDCGSGIVPAVQSRGGGGQGLGV